ncbi:MAG TPA: Sec-independent protein translocase subunit TatA [Mycobacteriales bacterium]|nr:Sec-independent protein translocase subunit TatA [Mycobacteriales bacterium]
MGSIGAPELLIVLVVFMVLFGAKRMPDAARSLGRSLRIFKAETKGLRDDDGDGFDDKTGKPMPAGSATKSDLAE